MKIKYSRSIKTLANELKKDILFYNKHTELLAIWTALFAVITTLFTLVLFNTSLLAIAFLVLAIIGVTAAISYFTIFYLHSLQYGTKKHLFFKIHNLSNKSFLIRMPTINLPQIHFGKILTNIKA